MHFVPAELAICVDGSGRVAFCLAALASTAIDRPRGLIISDPHQDYFVSAYAAVGVQGVADGLAAYRSKCRFRIFEPLPVECPVSVAASTAPVNRE